MYYFVFVPVIIFGAFCSGGSVSFANVAAGFVRASLLGKRVDFLNAGGKDAFVFKIGTAEPRRGGGEGEGGGAYPLAFAFIFLFISWCEDVLLRIFFLHPSR